MRRLWLSLALVAAVGALVASVTFAVGQAGRTRPVGPGMMAGQGWYGTGTGMMGGTGMEAMMGTVWLAGDGTRITSIAAARDRATTAGASIGLHPGEVIWFDNGFYVELKDPAGESATEVIVDPFTGGVRAPTRAGRSSSLPTGWRATFPAGSRNHPTPTPATTPWRPPRAVGRSTGCCRSTEPPGRSGTTPGTAGTSPGKTREHGSTGFRTRTG